MDSSHWCLVYAAFTASKLSFLPNEDILELMMYAISPLKSIYVSKKIR